MECYEGATMIRSFRGKIAGDDSQQIDLHTVDGSQGYRIKKFEVMPASFSGDQVGLVTINSIAYTPASTIDFNDTSLLAAAIVRTGNIQLRTDETIVFDNITFNQDIFIGLKNLDAAIDVNYHLELELIKLDLSENTVATLMDIRNLEPGG